MSFSRLPLAGKLPVYLSHSHVDMTRRVYLTRQRVVLASFKLEVVTDNYWCIQDGHGSLSLAKLCNLRKIEV